jgi:hypothetical protein
MAQRFGWRALYCTHCIPPRKRFVHAGCAVRPAGASSGARPGASQVHVTCPYSVSRNRCMSLRPNDFAIPPAPSSQEAPPVGRGRKRGTTSCPRNGLLPLSRTGQALEGCRKAAYGRGGRGVRAPAEDGGPGRCSCRCVRDARPQGRERGGADTAVPCPPLRGLGAVGNGCIVAYGARSPAPACGGHARNCSAKVRECESGWPKPSRVVAMPNPEPDQK